MRIEINLPTDDEEELLRRFTVNRNYLQAAAGFITTVYGRREKLYEGLRATVEGIPVYQRIQRGMVDLEEVRRFLSSPGQARFSSTCRQLCVTIRCLHSRIRGRPFMRTTRSTRRCRLWFVANGMTGVADDHTATLRTVSKQIEQRDLFPEPWNLLAIGCPCARSGCISTIMGTTALGISRALGPHTVRRGPRLLAAHGHLAAQHARGTPDRPRGPVEAAGEEAADREGRADEDRAEFAPTSIFDCFWRMRIKSNYGTIDSYLVNYVSESDHAIYNPRCAP